MILFTPAFEYGILVKFFYFIPKTIRYGQKLHDYETRYGKSPDRVGTFS